MLDTIDKNRGFASLILVYLTCCSDLFSCSLQRAIGPGSCLWCYGTEWETPAATPVALGL